MTTWALGVLIAALASGMAVAFAVRCRPDPPSAFRSGTGAGAVPDRATSVYIFRDARTGESLRIGIAHNVDIRYRRGYLVEQPWWLQYAVPGPPEVEGTYPNWAAAHAREIQLIAIHHPPGNHQHNPGRGHARSTAAGRDLPSTRRRPPGERGVRPTDRGAVRHR